MSRPPRPRAQRSTSGAPDADARSMDYLPLEHADLVALQRDLADELPGLSQPDAEGDFAGSLMELSALAGHVLGLYQDRYATEAFLSTARSPRSLVMHGRRLGYEPAPAVAATGYVRLVAKGAAGRVEAGFGLSSTSTKGGAPQDYETLEDVEVDPAHNDLVPRDAYVTWGDTHPDFLDVPGLGLGLSPGDPIVIAGSGRLHADSVSDAREIPLRRVTRLKTTSGLPAWASTRSVTLYARPKTRAHLFGVLLDPSDVSNAELTHLPNTADVTTTWTPDDPNRLYLSDELRAVDATGPAVRLFNGTLAAFELLNAQPVQVTFQKVTTDHITTPTLTIAVAGAPTTTVSGTVIPTTKTVAMTRTVTSLKLYPPSAAPHAAERDQHDPRASVWLLGWKTRIEVPWTGPNLTPANGAIELAGAYDGLAAGTLVALSTAPSAEAAPSAPEIARLTQVEIVTAPVPFTRIAWRVLDPVVNPRGWLVNELTVCANVVPVSHGRTVTEALGDSDGVTGFLRFTLRNKPVTYLPSAEGAEPALVVRVDDLRWERVIDFEDSGPHDRHYVVQRDEAGALAVVFGDGIRGAVPPSGRRNVTARYRVGAGAAGNAPAGGVSQIRKSHPLVESASNPRAIRGGVDAAQSEDVRANATQYLRTFDRAVSAADHADLALRFPAVAKARATWTVLPQQGVEGVLLVVADAEGDPPDLDLERSGFRRFMNARRDTSIPMEVTGPSAVPIYVEIKLGIDDAAEPDLVKKAVGDELHGRRAEAPGMFTFAGRELGQPAFLSELHERLEALPGVTTVRVVRLSPDPIAPEAERVRGAIAARPDEWLSLDPANLTLDTQENP
ncbi:MAG: hypothetical protein JWM10_3166 [Myxococcaceae bacterium]|nr:hypothetical protein [Myxococcaceae bacterium]